MNYAIMSAEVSTALNLKRYSKIGHRKQTLTLMNYQSIRTFLISSKRGGK
jgi:hypothetical protein